MEESKELKRIKKMYGENFMKLCRELFPTILEREGLLTEILMDSFATNGRTLCEDITEVGLVGEFKDYIYSKVDVEKEQIARVETKTPYELLEEAGYDLYECNSEEEIQSFKKYYKEGEELCTFLGGRLGRCVVFWAVKKNAEEIKREDFKNPKREDEYGTSVMGIQFSKLGKCTVSIKNRYNHTVNNPDATYGNDLDRIAPGLQQSFERLLAERGLKLNGENKEEISIPNYVMTADGKYYKYNMEIDGIYYCPGNIIIENGEAKSLGDTETQLLIDYFILDLKNKTLNAYDKRINEMDSFVNYFEDMSEIGAKIKIEKNKEKGTRIITIQKGENETITIEIDKNNQIIGYNNQYLKQVENSFLVENRSLEKLELPQLEKVGSGFLYSNESLEKLNLPQLKEIGYNFLYSNDESLKKLNLPRLEKVGGRFLYNNVVLTELELPQLKEVGHDFLYFNETLKKLNLPQLEKVEGNFLAGNRDLTELELPQLKAVGRNFLKSNEVIKKIELPQLKEVKDDFLCRNMDLTELNLPRLEKVGHNFLYCNEVMTEIELPQLKEVGNGFLYSNKSLEELNLPQLKKVGSSFLDSNEVIRQIELPQLKEVKVCFLAKNRALVQLNLPQLEKVGRTYFYSNQEDYFLKDNKNLTQLYTPKLPKLQEKFSHIIEQNLKKQDLERQKQSEESNQNADILEKDEQQEQENEKNRVVIDSRTIARLDKETGLTTAEIKAAQRELEEKEKDTQAKDEI